MTPATFRPPGWRHQGSEAITVWCRTCRCRTLRHDSGRCLFCDTQLTKPPLAQTPRGRKFAPPGSTSARLHAYLLENGPSTTPDLARIFGIRRDTVGGRLHDLRRYGLVEKVGAIPADIDPITGFARGRPRIVYRAVGEERSQFAGEGVPATCEERAEILGCEGAGNGTIRGVKSPGAGATAQGTAPKGTPMPAQLTPTRPAT